MLELARHSDSHKAREGVISAASRRDRHDPLVGPALSVGLSPTESGGSKLQTSILVKADNLRMARKTRLLLDREFALHSHSLLAFLTHRGAAC